MVMKRVAKSSVSELDRATFSVDDLTETIRHLTLRMKVTETLCHTIEVGRAADALKIAAAEAERVEQGTADQVSAEENRKPVVPRSERLEVQESKSAITKNGKLDDGSRRSKKEPTEHAIAASIAELYDRVGGFIKR